jgi:hypothetical protein
LSLLVTNSHQNAPICPSEEVKQGCPLGPRLFALFLSDIEAAFGVRHATGRMGVPLKLVERGLSGAQHVMHLLLSGELEIVDISQDSGANPNSDTQTHELRQSLSLTDRGLIVNVSAQFW